jgi:Mce-associated membrane protein
VSPSLYDLLNVDESASTEEIRAAWKAAIADLDPTDRRFRAFNQAAETLLDPERRKAYDAGLADTEPAEVEPEPISEPEPEEEPEPEPEAEPDDEPEPAIAESGPRSVSGRMLAAAGALALAAIAGTVWIWTQPGASGDVDTYQEREEAAQQAAAVAEEAIDSVLSYDYRHLEDDVAKAAPYFTDDYAAEYRSLIEELGPQAESAKLVVKGSAIATGIIRSGDDRAEILVFVNQESTRAGTENEPLRMWVTMTMVSDGDGWLIDKMKVDTATPS